MVTGAAMPPASILKAVYLHDEHRRGADQRRHFGGGADVKGHSTARRPIPIAQASTSVCAGAGDDVLGAAEGGHSLMRVPKSQNELWLSDASAALSRTRAAGGKIIGQWW